MKNARPVQNQPGALDACQRSQYTSTRQIITKAAPWLALQSLAVLVLTLSAGGLA